jgi:hypothetical protein
MIYPIRRLPQAERYLRYILALQVEALEAAAQHGVSQDDILDPVTNQTRFNPILQERLETKRRFRGRSQDVGNWVTRKKADLLKPLSLFSQGPEQEKSNFIEGVKHDINLLFFPASESLSIAITDESASWEKQAGDFLYTFYDLWRDRGFDNYFFLRNSPFPRYMRLNMVDEFIERNPSLYVCTICDGSSYKTQTEARAFTSVEHFFPRSIYPHLSCHPRNLVPICSFCNSYIKGDKDPLDLGDGVKLTLVDMPLPYQDFIFQKQAYIAVVARNPYNKDEHPHPMRLELKAARDVDIGQKITAINHLYKVDERWSEELNQIEEQAFRRLFQFLTLAGPGNPVATPEDAITQLRTLMAITDMENLGKDPYAFPMVWLLKSYVDQIQQKERISSVFQALEYWGQEIHERWIMLQERAEEIEGRVA